MLEILVFLSLGFLVHGQALKVRRPPAITGNVLHACVSVHISGKRVYSFHQILNEKMCPLVPLTHPEVGTQLPTFS